MTSPVFSVAGPVLNISGSGAFALTRPAVNPGDLMLMRYAMPYGDATFNPDAAWALVDKYDAATGFQSEIGVYWKIAGASEPNTYSVSISGQGGGNNIGSAQILVYAGGASAATINAHANTSGAASVTIGNPSVTTTVSDTVLIAYYGDRTDLSTETFTPAPGMTQRAAGRSGDGVPWAWDDQPIAAAGATGTKNATASAAHAWSSVVFAITPSVAGPVPTTVNLVAANSTETPTSGTGAATVTPPTAGTVNLIAANSTETPTSGTGAATVSAVTATVTSDVFKGFGGLPLANLNIPNVMLIKLDRTVALSLANQVTNASGQLVVTSSALSAGTDYMLATFNADGTLRGMKKVTAV